jgi:hypothetical protein
LGHGSWHFRLINPGFTPKKVIEPVDKLLDLIPEAVSEVFQLFFTVVVGRLSHCLLLTHHLLLFGIDCPHLLHHLTAPEYLPGFPAQQHSSPLLLHPSHLLQGFEVVLAGNVPSEDCLYLLGAHPYELHLETVWLLGANLLGKKGSKNGRSKSGLAYLRLLRKQREWYLRTVLRSLLRR